MSVELKRDIYKKLEDWKKERTGKVLELSGARQVGKTFILKKFARENYSYSIYINMVEDTGKAFLKCLYGASAWEPGHERPGKPIHKALELYDPNFEDTKDVLVIIDEIQDSPEVYGKIRNFAREFCCDFIVTGSYLGKTREKEFFQAAGDVNFLTMTTMTFPEFLDAFDKRHIYDEISLFGESDHELYDELKSYFEVYLKIGGYPEVVKTYLEKRDVRECLKRIEEIIQVFIMESTKYFGDPLENEIFRKILSTVAIVLLKEKKGIKDLVTDFSKIIFKEESNKLSKKTINSAIGWLYLSHQIGYADKSVDCDYLNLVDNCRFYYRDVGLANYFLTNSGAEPNTIKGVLCENYVYLNLLERLADHEIAGANPWFGTYERISGELDFYCRSLLDYKNYGLEVKAGNNTARTANDLLEAGKLDYVYNLKDTYGAREGKKLAVPNYLVGRISFALDA
jgi:predicted AAA+ superfamily ATPase